MSEKFSFKTAEELISILNSSCLLLERDNERLYDLYETLKSGFNDSRYYEYFRIICKASDDCVEILQSIREVIEQLEHYKEEIYRYYIEDFIEKVVVPIIAFGLLIKQKGKDNKQLKLFSDVIEEKLTSGEIPYAIKIAYMRIGSRCSIISSDYKGVAYFDFVNNGLTFNLREDLYNECGRLSTYFHEVGHMIDYNAVPGKCLSDEVVFKNALTYDCQQYIKKIMREQGCSIDSAYLEIKKKLMQDNNLYEDVSDIMGALTDGKCQNLWGHSKAYWEKDKNRIQREAFADMYSTLMQGGQRVEVMKEFFPNAFVYFEKMMEELI